MAALLGLECASSNDQSFSNSDMRRTARTMLQFLPGTDFILSLIHISKEFELEESVKRAKQYLSDALEFKLDLGAGSGPMNHAFAWNRNE